MLRMHASTYRGKQHSIEAWAAVVPGTMWPGEYASCSLSLKKFSGFWFRTMEPTRMSGNCASGHVCARRSPALTATQALQWRFSASMHAVHHDPVRLNRVRRCRSKCSLTCGGAAQRPRLPQPAEMTPAAGPRCAARRHARTCPRGRPARQATGAGPRLGGVERVEVERVRDRGRHRLHPQLPLGVGAALDRVVEVGGRKAAVRGRGRERGDVALQQALHAYAAQPLHLQVHGAASMYTPIVCEDRALLFSCALLCAADGARTVPSSCLPDARAQQTLTTKPYT